MIRKSKQRKEILDSTSSNDSYYYSSQYLKQLLERLKSEQYAPSTSVNYHKIWRKFNEFIIKLDNIPDKWEERFTLYCSFLVNIKGLQSATIKSYKSAIKAILVNDGYKWSDDEVAMATFIKNSKLKNDTVLNRFPIRRGLLELMLYELGRKYQDQPYLEKLYLTIFSTMYHGLLRVSEVSNHEHSVKVTDVHITHNNSKALFILRSSKTHHKGQRPQKIEILCDRSRPRNDRSHFCPVQLAREYSSIRKSYLTESEPFFVFSDRSPIPADQIRRVLREVINNLGLNGKLYDTHSFRGGRATDLKKLGYSVDDVKAAGRWRSNAVYEYLR